MVDWAAFICGLPSCFSPIIYILWAFSCLDFLLDVFALTEHCSPNVTPQHLHKCFITTCGGLGILSHWTNRSSQGQCCIAHMWVYPNGQNCCSQPGWHERDKCHDSKQSFFLAFCHLLVDFIVLLSNALNVSFITDPKSSATDFINYISNQKIILVLGSDVSPYLICEYVRLSSIGLAPHWWDQKMWNLQKEISVKAVCGSQKLADEALKFFNLLFSVQNTNKNDHPFVSLCKWQESHLSLN